jgi:large subunit ribosomal protein L35
VFLLYPPDLLRKFGVSSRLASKGLPWRLTRIVLKGLNKMPKMKTKSAAKKRFRFTASGLVKAGGAGKRHGMIKRSNKQIRNQRGTMILAPGDEGLVKIHMPYAGKY